MISFEYDRTDPKSIEKHAKQLIGHTFRDVLLWNSCGNITKNIANKGQLGNIVEEHFFKYKQNSNRSPDFKEAEVELKVTPIKQLKTGEERAKERLVITDISYHTDIKETFYNSHLWSKLKHMLLIFYLYDAYQDDKLFYFIKYVSLFTPAEADLQIIEEDYNKIITKITSGKAHELSESDTMYLAACTKGSSSADRRTQPFSEISAKPRAFSLKQSYMSTVLKEISVKSTPDYEHIEIIKNHSLEESITAKLSKHIGKTLSELKHEFNLNSQSKSTSSLVVFRMLGLKSNKALELTKANISVKTIILEQSGVPKESLSFPLIDFNELANNSWEESQMYNLFASTKYLFAVFMKNSQKEPVFIGCKLWNMPHKDLEVAYNFWQECKKIISSGLIISFSQGKYHSNLPKKNNPVCHIRPHGRNASDTCTLPDGQKYPKQSFWLNREYIASQLKDIKASNMI